MPTSTDIIAFIIGALVTSALVVIVYLLAKTPAKNRPSVAIEPSELIRSEEQDIYPPSFEVTNLMVTPSQAKEGEKVTILAQVSNVGGSQGAHKATLHINGRAVGIKEVSLGAGESAVVDFQVSENGSGEYQIDLDGLRGGFIIPPAKFKLSNLTVSPERVKEGANVTISAEVANEGGATGSYTAELKVRGAVEMTQSLTLAPGTNQIVTFTICKKKAGFYPIEVGALFGKITVEMSDFFEKI